MEHAPKHASPTSEITAHPQLILNLTAMPHLNPTPAIQMPTLDMALIPMAPILTIMMIILTTLTLSMFYNFFCGKFKLRSKEYKAIMI